MKKTLLVAALAAVLVLSFATSAFAIGPFFGTAGYYNTGVGTYGPPATNDTGIRYLDWEYVLATGQGTGSPHGGYTASTNKCAVCHSVHQAVAGKSVLTAYGPYSTYAAGCVACHGPATTFTDVKMTANADGYISPHGTCTRCHVINPHGAQGSKHAVLSSKLLNTTGDAFIDADLGATANGLSAAMFNGTGTAIQSEQGLILGTGYLCSGCHQQAFAVNTASTNPNGGSSGATGHRVLASASAGTYNAATYGGASTATQVAWNDAYGCDSCHNMADAAGDSAFPHGYVNAAGAVAPKTVAGSSYVWLTTGSYAGSADTTMLATGVDPDTAMLLTEDGLCLKCHRGSATTGVGLTF